MIHVENLTKYFNELCAVDQITFDIQKGEIMGLLGPNGAGKTTFLRMLTGYLGPTSGTIRVKDYTIDEHSLEIKKLLGDPRFCTAVKSVTKLKIEECAAPKTIEGINR